MKRILGLLLVGALWLGLAAPATAVLQPVTRVGNAAYTILSTDQNIITTTAFSTGRTWTLPFAAASCIGQNCRPAASALTILDVAGAISSSGALTIAPQSGDTINGNAANLIITGTRAKITLIPTSGNNWEAYVEGDVVSSSVLAASAVALTTATAANITSVSLSQGVWSCTGTVARTTAATTSVTELKQSISATTATSGTLGTTMTAFITAANVLAGDPAYTVGPVRLSLAATTTYYLVAEDVFTVDTNAGYGSIVCQRMR